MKNTKRTSIRAASFIIGLIMISGSTFGSGNQDDETQRAARFNLDDGLALEGYDPVSYFINEEPREGDPDISTEYRGVTYHFESEENREAFLDDPEQYEPLYGGYCAYTMLDGERQSVNPEIYKIVDDQLLLFYRMRFGIMNALSRWNDEAEDTEGGDQTLMQQAGEHWERMLNN